MINTLREKTFLRSTIIEKKIIQKKILLVLNKIIMRERKLFGGVPPHVE